MPLIDHISWSDANHGFTCTIDLNNTYKMSIKSDGNPYGEAHLAQWVAQFDAQGQPIVDDNGVPQYAYTEHIEVTDRAGGNESPPFRLKNMGDPSNVNCLLCAVDGYDAGNNPKYCGGVGDSGVGNDVTFNFHLQDQVTVVHIQIWQVA